MVGTYATGNSLALQNHTALVDKCRHLLIPSDGDDEHRCEKILDILKLVVSSMEWCGDALVHCDGLLVASKRTSEALAQRVRNICSERGSADASATQEADMLDEAINAAPAESYSSFQETSLLPQLLCMYVRRK